MTDRRRNLFVLLAVLGLIFASIAVIATKQTRLGLDLKGGVELIYEAKPTKQSEVTPDALNRAVDIMRERVDRLGVAEPEIQTLGGGQIQVGLPDVKNAEQAQRQVGQVAQLFFYDWEANVVGPDGKTAVPKEGPVTQDSYDITGGPNAGQGGALDRYGAVIRASRRPAADRPNATTEGTFYLIDDKAKKVVVGPEEEEDDLFTSLNSGGAGTPAKSGGGQTSPGPNQRIVEVKVGTTIVRAEQQDGAPQVDPNDAQYYVLNDDPALRGTDIKNPEQNFDQQGGGGPIVTFDFTSKGRDTWQEVTRQIARRGQNSVGAVPDAQANQHFAIVLDDELVSVPFIDFRENPDGIDGVNGSQIEGGFTIQSAQELANLLKSGALPIKLELISQSQVSATLGKQALDQGLIAGAAGFLIVALFLLLFYRVLGLIAVGALVIYSLYFFALIKLIPITLTLPGIAGLILTISVAADANIVIFERVKEEVRAGRSVAAGIAAGYRKGITAIIDANVVTFMVAFILFILATAGVKGFAFVLGIGTLVSLFTAVLATQAVLATMGKSRLISGRAALGARESKPIRFDFMGVSKWFFAVSGMILLVCALAIGSQGLTFGIDFESGTRITTALEEKTDEDGVRAAVTGLGYEDAEIQRVSNEALGDNAFSISAKIPPNRVGEVRDALDDQFGGTPEFENSSIGPSFGQSVARSAVIAIIASLLVVSVYIALRFEWKYAVPVLIALAHDLLITGGVYSLIGREVTTSTVAALLTILGFSLYDTIIVFDRIRENVPRMPRAAFSQIVNRSMSEVIVRSLATSFCTLLPVLALLLFGGDTLQDFAFALLVGTASGTYSSVFIAGPVLSHWKQREPVYEARAKRIFAEHGHIPAYATGGAGIDVPVDDEPVRRTRLTTPTEPDALPKSEQEELMRQHLATLEAERAPAPAVDPTADLSPEDVVMPGQERKPKAPKPKRPRNKRHGRSR